MTALMVSSQTSIRLSKPFSRIYSSSLSVIGVAVSRCVVIYSPDKRSVLDITGERAISRRNPARCRAEQLTQKHQDGADQITHSTRAITQPYEHLFPVDDDLQPRTRRLIPPIAAAGPQRRNILESRFTPRLAIITPRKPRIPMEKHTPPRFPGMRREEGQK